MRVAVIGCGSIGRRHIGNLLALGCEVTATDISSAAVAEASAAFPQASIGMSVVRLLGLDPIEELHVVGLWRASIDAWVIATPAGDHLRWVERCVQERKPFFVEKPLGTLEQLPRWRELAALHLPVNQVGYMLRFQPVANRLREHRTARCGTFTVACDMGTWPGRAYGPPLLELSHEIDLALWCGAPATVTYAAITDDAVYITCGDHWSITLDSRAPHYRRFWRVSDGFAASQHAFRDPEALGETMYRDELAHFLLCVRHGLPTNVPLADGLRVLEVCDQVEQLARQMT